MRMYKILTVVFLILFLLVGAASASELDGIGDNLMVDDNTYDSGINEDIQNSNNGVSNLNAANSQALDESNGDLEVLSNSNSDSESLMNYDEGSQVLEANRTFSGSSFSQLQDEINNCNVNDIITLTSDIYQDGSSYISIKKSITIDGNGHIIDAQGRSRIFQIQSNVTLKNIIFKNANNRAIHSSSNILVSNCTFINNSALSGSAIFLEVNNGKIEYCSFINNTARDGSGGAIFLQGVPAGNNKNITIQHCTFEYNSAAVKGGAIYSDGENFTINNCTFRYNSAYEGGAIYNNYIGFITNCNFTNNHANNGGAIYNYHEATVIFCNFTNNSANIGGAVYSKNNCSLDNSTFNANSATNSGGAVYSVDNYKYIVQCDFYNNTANDGGAIHWTGDLGSIQFCSFLENNASDNGGALFLKSFGVYVLELSSFFKNTAKNGGAVYIANSSVNLDLNSFLNHTAINGGALYAFNSSVKLNFCHFNYNLASLDAGVMYLNDSNATIEDSYFESNAAVENGSAIYTFSTDVVPSLNITGSTFLNNKAKSNPLVVYENSNVLTVGFSGGNNFINAIFADTIINLNLSDVTYWSGEIVNSDNERYHTGRKGHPVVLEIYGSYNELIINTTLSTNVLGQQYYDLFSFNNGTYQYKAYHLEDNYYPYVETTGNFSVTKATSSITLDIPDYSEFYFSNCSIPFTVVNRTMVTVLITDEAGSYVYMNKTVDQFSKHVDVNLASSDYYYKITVFNINNSAYGGSQDSKLFKILKAPSTISIEDIGDVIFGKAINLTFNVEYKTHINVTVYDEEGNITYTAITDNDTITLPVLPIGEYNVTLTNIGTRNIIESNCSTIFNILKADNVVTVSANNVTYGNYTLIIIRANVDGIYLLDVNGSMRNVSVENTIGRVYYSLPVGDYYANVTFDDVNCNNSITNTTFTVFKADNFVSVYLENGFNGDVVTVVINATADGVYLLDVNGTLMNVTVVDGIGRVELSIPAGEYYANVTFDNDNYNSYINNTTWFKPNDVVIPPVLSKDGVGSIILDLPEGTSGNVTVYVNHDQLSSLPVYGGKNIIPLFVSDIGQNTVTVVFVDNSGYAYELTETVYVKKSIDQFDIEFSNDTSVLGFTVYMNVDVTGVLYVHVADEVYPMEIKDGAVTFSLSGLPSGFYVVELEYMGDDRYEGFLRGFFVDIEQDDIDYGPEFVNVNHTDAGDAADLQAAIDMANPGDIILLGYYDYTNVSCVNITKPITIDGSGDASIASSGDGVPIFNVPAISDGGPESVNLRNVVFKLNNGDVVVKATADNGTNPLSIVTPSIDIEGNTFELANDDVVGESVVVLMLESERGSLSPTREIVVSGNTIAAGVDPFEFKVTSISSGGDTIIVPQNISLEKKASVIEYKDMTTTAVDVDTDGRIGEYFKVVLKDADGHILAGKQVQIGFNGKIYNRTTDENGSCKLQINLVRTDIYTFAVSFLGDEQYNGSFVVAKITVNTQKGSLTVPNKSYAASAKTKSLTATFKAASGKVVANKKITFTVNGKTYSAVTNAKGVATVNVSINKKGTYSFTAKYAGDGTYAAISKSAKLTIK